MPVLTACLFLIFTLPIGIWVAWSDMRAMRIPNPAVLSLTAVWLVVGLISVGLGKMGYPGLDLSAWLWGIAIGVAVLAVLFLANMAGMMGAGDSKFGAAMAPFFVHADLRSVTFFLAACLLGAFAAHRILRAIPAVRAASPDWVSWTHHKFPMGLALAGMLNFYLLSAAILPLLAGS